MLVTFLDKLGTQWPSVTLGGRPPPSPILLTQRDPGWGQSCDPCTVTRVPARTPKVTQEPPTLCPQQLRSLPSLSMGVSVPPKPKGAHRLVSRGNNCKATRAVGLPRVGPAPWGTTCAQRHQDKCPHIPGMVLPPQSHSSVPPQLPQHLPHPKIRTGTTRRTIPLYWGAPSTPPDRALWPSAIFIPSGGRAPVPSHTRRRHLCPGVPHFRSPKLVAATRLGGIVTSTEQPARLTPPSRTLGPFQSLLGDTL